MLLSAGQRRSAALLIRNSTTLILFWQVKGGWTPSWKSWRTQNLGAFHLAKNPGSSETGTNSTEISSEDFRKIRGLLYFRIANHSTKNFGMKIKWCRNSRKKNFLHLLHVSGFSRNCGKCCFIHRWKNVRKWNRKFFSLGEHQFYLALNSVNAIAYTDLFLLLCSRAVARKNLWLRQCPWNTYDRGNLSMV